MGEPQQVDMAARGPARDPAAFARGRRDPPVEAGGKLQRHHRAAKGHAAQEAALQGGCRLGPDALGDLDALGAQHGMAAPGDARVGIGQRRDDPRDARTDQSFGAGRGAAVVGAGFKGDIGRCPPRGRTRHVQRHPLGMGTPAGLGPAPARDPAICHDHAAHGGVRPDVAQAPPRQPQRVVHVAQVGGHSDAGRSSDTKRSKSSAAWKFL